MTLDHVNLMFICNDLLLAIKILTKSNHVGRRAQIVPREVTRKSCSKMTENDDKRTTALHMLNTDEQGKKGGRVVYLGNPSLSH